MADELIRDGFEMRCSLGEMTKDLPLCGKGFPKMCGCVNLRFDPRVGMQGDNKIGRDSLPSPMFRGAMKLVSSTGKVSGQITDRAT